MSKKKSIICNTTIKTLIIFCGVAGLCTAFNPEWSFNMGGISISHNSQMYFFRGLKYGEM
jgi:hypothetical protein